MTEPDAAAAASPAELLRDEPLSIVVGRSSLAFEGRIWDVRSDTFDYNGEPMTREYVDHPGAVAIVAIDGAERVLLIQQYRHPVRRRDWEIPAGLLDVDGESPLESAQRELHEEADLAADRWEPLISVFSSPGGNSEVVHIFLAHELHPADEIHVREAEEADIRVEWVALEDAVTAVLEGRMRNAILAAGVLAAAEHRRRARRAAKQARRAAPTAEPTGS